ncbi:MAG TPA: bacteriohopanetetrol glucosamine biosynthesis glycosyltransferase HpnI [Anaeromyxobacter sp.]
MTPLALALLALTAASCGYWLLALFAVRRLLAHPPPAPPALPPVSLLKPVRGLEPGARESFESFLQVDYPEREVLFGVADPDDPVLPLLEQLEAEHPALAIRIVVAPAPGPNRKAQLLEALSRAARFDVLVATDADMRVAPSYLRDVVASLMAPGVGLVTCPYRGVAPASLPARLEALHMGVTFLPSAAMASAIVGIPFAMGSTMALRRSDLQAVGGFGALSDHLADDYELGARVGALGRRVATCPHVVASVLGRARFRDVWDREVRWSRCARAGRPLGHAGYALTFTTPLALAALAASGFAPEGWAALAGSLALRWIVATAAARATGDGASLRALPLLPIRDCLTAAVWATALVGRRVVWRGEAFEVDRAGRLHPLTAVTPAGAPAARSTGRPAAR